MTGGLFADFTDIIGMCSSSVTIERTGPGRYIGGVYRKDPTPETFHCTGSMQPATPEEIQRLPELQRTEEVFAFFTTFKLQVGDAESREESPDIVIWKGQRFEVSGEEAWKHLGNFYKYLIVGVAQ